MDKKMSLQLKAFLLSHQSGEDLHGYLAALQRTAMLHPSQFKGKLPSAGGFKPDHLTCKVVVSTARRPIIPWWWYVAQKEPVPAVVEDIFAELVFDYVLVYPQKNIWIYILLEPQAKILGLLQKQEALRAFILMSIVNKNLKPQERETRRLRLGKLLSTPEIGKIITLVAYGEGYELSSQIPKGIPTLMGKVNSTGTSWQINYPGQKQTFWSFKELLATISVQIQAKRK